MELVTNPWAKFLGVWIVLFIMLSFSLLLIGIGKHYKKNVIIYIGSALMFLVAIVFLGLIGWNHLSLIL